MQDTIFKLNFDNNSSIILSEEMPQTFLLIEMLDENYKLNTVSVKVVEGNAISINEFIVNKDEVKTFDDLKTIDLMSLFLKYVSKKGYSKLQITINIKDNTNASSFYMYYVDIQYKVDNNESISVLKPTHNINNELSSAMLVRTNPLLSGNIKLIIDEKQNIFLDTFKVSDNLSKKSVRKQQVSASGTYANDIRRVFSKIPSADIFKINSYDTLDISIPKQQLSQQYSTTYNYGARMFKDELYTEEFSIFAPIWLNKELPDYFVVFRLPSIFNEESYTGKDMSQLLNSFIKNGEVVKTWCLKNNFPLGKYLNNHLNELLSFDNNVFVSMSDIDTNKWAGISVKNGIHVQMSEHTHDFDSFNGKFTDINNYITNGFYRNNVICSNLLNLEFIFDDKDINEGEMYRYFGLYLNENEITKFNLYKKNSQTLLNISHDMSNIENIFDANNKIAEEYKDRIFSITNPYNFKRINELAEIENIDETFVNIKKQLIINDTANIIKNKRFVTVNILDVLPSGYHINLQKNNGDIIGIYVSDIEIYDNDMIGENIFKFENYTLINISSNCTLEEQLNSIVNAFNYMNDYSYEVLLNKNTISFFDINNTFKDVQIINNNFTLHNYEHTDDMYLSFFENYTNFQYDVIYVKFFECFGNRECFYIPFVNTNTSYSIAKTNIDKISNVIITNSINKETLLIEKYNELDVLYVNDPYDTSRILISFNGQAYIFNNNIICYSLEDTSISIMGILPIKDFDFVVNDKNLNENFKSEYWFNRENDDKLNTLEIKKDTSLKLPSNNVFYIQSGNGYYIKGNDINNTYSFNINSDENKIFNTYFDDITLYAYTNVVLSNKKEILDSLNYATFKENYSEEDINDYIQNNVSLYENKYLNHGLVTPYICKWVMEGSDCRSNRFRLFLDNNAFEKIDDVCSNFVPYKNTNKSFFTNELIYPTYKYINNDLYDSVSYVYYDINKTISLISSSGEEIKGTFKDFLISEEYKNIDLFSKFLFKNIYDAHAKPTLLTYNKYFNSLETIFMGNKYSLTFNELNFSDINIASYDKFRFCAVLCNTGNATSNKEYDIIINEIHGYIILVWYQNAQDISYSRRNLNVVFNKNIMDNNANEIKRSFKDEKLSTYIKSNFILDTSKPAFKVHTINDLLYYNSNNVKHLTQISESSRVNTIFNLFGDGTIENNILYYDNENQYNTFKTIDDVQDFVVGDITFINKYTYGKNIINEAFFYDNNDNIYLNTTSELEAFKTIEKSYNIATYILNKQRVINSNLFNNDNLVNVKIINPTIYNKMITHNGWYMPLFKNVVEFEFCDKIQDHVNIDLTLSNTKINKTNNIEQYWYYCIKDNLSEEDINSDKILDFKISYKSFNPCSSLWDKSYFTKLNSDNINISTNGYNCDTELPSFFGSKLIKLPETLLLNKWDLNSLTYKIVTNTYYSEISSSNVYEVSLNITKNIQNYFLNNAIFINNWNKLPVNESNYITIISEYINNTISSYYSINSKFETKILFKPYTNNIIEYNTSDFNIENIMTNIKSEILSENNEIVLKVYVPEDNIYTYGFEINIK